MRVLLFLAVLAVLAGGGVWAAADADRPDRPDRPDRADRADRAADPDRPPPARPEATAKPTPRRHRASPLPASTCPAEVSGCRAVSGRVLYVESVDPDGDGDLHVVLASRAGVSGPGITAIDVKPALRPRRDPEVGDRVSAAGPVQRGSYGQSQVHALEFHLRRSSGAFD